MQVPCGLDTQMQKKALYGHLRVHLGEVFRDLARQKESKVLEGHLQSDHVHMLLAIPPKYSVAQVIGYMKGKSAIHIARAYLGRKELWWNELLGTRLFLFQLLAPMKRLYARISEIKKKRISCRTTHVI